jgi:micrococcal nuclease
MARLFVHAAAPALATLLLAACAAAGAGRVEEAGPAPAPAETADPAVSAGDTAAGSAAGGTAGRPGSVQAAVARVIDGDTLVLRGGSRVRLVQIDATELGSGECYSRKAARVLRELLPAGTAVRLEADPSLDAVDGYGRLLRYVFRGKLNVNLELVRRGAATVWFYRGDRGRYAARLLAAARAARAARRGMWGSCQVVWDPEGPATAYGGGSSPPPTAGDGGGAGGSGGGSAGSGCHPSYDPCLPIVDDLDCGEIDDSLKPIHVLGDDPYRLDGDHDGLGCE